MSDPLRPGAKTSETIAGLGGFGAIAIAASSGQIPWDHAFTAGAVILCGIVIVCRTALKIAAVIYQPEATKEPDHAPE